MNFQGVLQGGAGRFEIAEDFEITHLAEAGAGTFKIRMTYLVGVCLNLVAGCLQLAGSSSGSNFALGFKIIEREFDLIRRFGKGGFFEKSGS